MWNDFAKNSDSLNNKILMKKFYCVFVTLFFLSFQFSSAQVNTVTFVNTGAINVAPNGASGVSLYVPDAMRQLFVTGRTVGIIQNGITELGGNFYHDGASTVFQVGGNTLTTSTGKFRFVKERAVNRTITTQSTQITTFDRGSNYIAFPNFEIGTNDSIVVPGKMGIDAITVKRVNSKTGHLILRSDVVGANAYDASLRVTGAGASSSVVDLGAVVVERDMTVYRPNDGTTQLFGFATPFKNTQLSGYYAGNWVRRPLSTGTYGHTEYVYGNKNLIKGTTIDPDQYVYLAAEKLVPAQAYLIKPRPKGFDYSLLKVENGLWYTGEPQASAYDKGKFYFNGKVYTVAAYSEQLFADDNLYTNTINTGAGNLANTVNLLIGNSYTCPIPTNLLAQTMESSGLKFSPYIYVFPAGSTTYQPLSISGTGGGIVVSSVTEIPAMSIFMVRVSKGSVQNGTLTIGKTMQRHADVSHNNPQTVKSESGIQRIVNVEKEVNVLNQITLKVSPVGNDNIYDLAAIGLREDAVVENDSYDMVKAYVNDDNLFQLYTNTPKGTKLTANGLPLNTDTVKLSFEPSKNGGEYKLSTQYLESLQTEGLWLYDNKFQQWTDLKESKSYSFSSQPNDKSERFYIAFKAPKLEPSVGLINSISLYYNEDQLHVRQLSKSDLGSKLTIYDPTGRLMSVLTIDNYPLMTVPVINYRPGVYLVQLKGEQSGIAKFIKK